MVYKNKCKYCKKEFEFERFQRFASHVGNCKENPRYDERREKIGNRIRKKHINKIIKCKTCKKIFTLSLTEHQFKKCNRKFCSKKCVNTSKKGNNNVSKRQDVKLKLIKNHWSKSSNKLDTSKKLSESRINAWNKQKKLKIASLPFEKLSRKLRYEILFNERGNKCEICGYEYIDDKSKKGPFEIHHIDGIKLNNKKENLQILCMNCHWKTSNWRNRGNKMSIKSIIKSLETQRKNGTIKTHKYIHLVKGH